MFKLNKLIMVSSSGTAAHHEGEWLSWVLSGFQIHVSASVVRFARFLLVGFSGIFVNLFLHYLFTESFHTHYLTGAILATQGSSLWNFGLTELWVFKGRDSNRNVLHRVLMFLGMNNAALLIRGPMIVLLTEYIFGSNGYLLSNLLSILFLSVMRYVLADSWIWKRQKVNA